MKHLMIDLETLSIRTNAVVLSIGAVIFDENNIIDTLHLFLEPESQEAKGRSILPSTVMWWLQQSDEARKNLIAGEKNSTARALEHFTGWVLGHAPDCVWGNGAGFDNVITETLMRDYNAPIPWQHYQNQCYRTLKARLTNKAIKKGIMWHQPTVAHDALADALAQAKNTQLLLKLIEE